MDRYRTLSLGAYISGRTFYLHQLVDRPRCASCWGGRAISWETLEEMARYSKSIWPGLATTVRVAPSRLAAASFRWVYLDAGWAQYDTSEGDVGSYLRTEVEQAQLEGLGVVAGLNLLNASGGSTAPMTASQIRTFGNALVAEPSVCALLGWKYDATYLGQSTIRDALADIAAAARSRSAGSCLGT